ncbi:MAG: hypothetical protein JWM05_2635 [Acidimicrobiales bacterium]|nr:hypothetical protein [Acidimicrobiales bacterium]
MADKRDSSSQRRAKENRAAREALAARREGAARKGEDGGDAAEETRPTRRTRAQAAPVRGARPRRSDREPNETAANGAGAKPAPTPVEELTGSWFSKINRVPGGRAVMLSLVLSIVAAIIVLFVPRQIPLERWEPRLKGYTIESCANPKGKKVTSVGGKAITPASCGRVASEPAKGTGSKQDDKRLLAVIKDSIYGFIGPVALLFVLPPVIITAAALAFATRRSRRRAWNYAILGFAVWMVLGGGITVGGQLFIVALGALAWGVFKASRAEPRAPRPGRGGRGLFGRGPVDVEGAEVADAGDEAPGVDLDAGDSAVPGDASAGSEVGDGGVVEEPANGGPDDPSGGDAPSRR